MKHSIAAAVNASPLLGQVGIVTETGSTTDQGAIIPEVVVLWKQGYRIKVQMLNEQRIMLRRVLFVPSLETISLAWGLGKQTRYGTT